MNDFSHSLARDSLGFVSSVDLQLLQLLDDAHQRCERDGTQTAVLWLHLADFDSRITQRFGIAAERATLVDFAARLRARVTTSDIIGRSGPYQFMLLLADGSGAGRADEITADIRLSMQEPFAMPSDVPLVLDICIGHLLLGFNCATTGVHAYRDQDAVVYNDYLARHSR